MDNRVKYYDLDCHYPSNDNSFKLTLLSLCREIQEDCYTDEDEITEFSVRDKIKNSKKSGLIDRLKKQLNFDVEAISKGNKNEIFDEYKLLKLLYLMEHKGFIYDGKEYKKIAILDLISKPRLENIHTVFSNNDHYGYTYDYLCHSIEPFVNDPYSRCVKIQKISEEWNQIIVDLFYAYNSDDMKEKLFVSIPNLYGFQYLLEQIILPILKKRHGTVNTYSEGVFDTFYNLLICYFKKCDDEDRYLDESEFPAIFPNSNYIANYKKYDNELVSWDVIDAAKKYLSGEATNNFQAIKLVDLVFYDGIKETEINKCLYALDHVKSYWSVLEKGKNANDCDFRMGTLASIIQEIMYIKETLPQITNDHYKHENSQRSLLRTISTPKKQNGISFQVLIKRLQNRVSINTGQSLPTAFLRLIEKDIYEVKKQILSYQNLDDIVAIHSATLELVNYVLWTNLKSTNDLQKDYEKRIKNIFKNKTTIENP